MKDIIFYNYQIKIEELEEKKDYTVFKFHGNTFYFTKLKRNEKELEEILSVIEELQRRNLFVFPIVKNYMGSFITMVGMIPYVLILVQDEMREYGILEIMNFQKMLVLNNKKSMLYRSVWANLWCEKVDYLEYQVHERGKNYPVILNSFSYYVGLAETAIVYVRNIEKKIPMPKNLPIVLSHRRVCYPNYRLNFDNPLNFIFDMEVRDVASFIKNMFWKESENALIDLKTYIEIRKPDLYSLSMLYARLIYPSYYFDLHESIMEGELEEDAILPILDKVDEYEMFLKNVWLFIRSYVPIEPIYWIMQKEL